MCEVCVFVRVSVCVCARARACACGMKVKSFQIKCAKKKLFIESLKEELKAWNHFVKNPKTKK